MFTRSGPWRMAALCFLALASPPFLLPQGPTWSDLSGQVVELYSQGKYAEAVPLAEEAVRIAEANFGPDTPNMAASVDSLAALYRPLGRYEEAEKLYRRGLAIREKILGAEHPDVATSLITLGAVCQEQGKYSEAEALYTRAIRIEEKVFPSDHPDLAIALSNLGALYYEEGSYSAAEPLYKRAAAIQEKALGNEHPSLASSLNNLAVLYIDEAKYRDAEALLERVLTIDKKAFGEEDPSVATATNNLAMLYLAVAKYADAESLGNLALRIDERVRGPEHPDVARDLTNLADLYEKQDKYVEAERALQRALTIRQKVFGQTHPDVANSLNSLAGLYATLGRYPDAERLYLQCLAMREKLFGSKHPDLATSLNNLGALYDDKADYAKATLYYERAIAMNEELRGKEHPIVGEELNNLSSVYFEQNRYAEAERLLGRALSIRERAFGKEHPEVADTLNNMAAALRQQGKYSEAESLFKRALAIYEKILGQEHSEVARCLTNLGGVYHDQGRYRDAESLYRRALEMREKALGPDHLEVANSLNNLGTLYRTQGKYAEAEALFLRALHINEKVLGNDHPSLAADLNGLADLDENQGKFVEAEYLYKRALGIWEKAFGATNPWTATGSLNLAVLYRFEGKYQEAEALCLRAKAISETLFGKEHPDTAHALSALGLTYYKKGDYPSAERVLKQALEIREKTLGPEHPDLVSDLGNLAALYEAQERYDLAGVFFERSLQNLKNQFQYQFTYMSEKDRLSFLDSVAFHFPSYFSFCFNLWHRDPRIVAPMYDVVLWQKGLVTNSISSLRTKIAESGDSVAKDLFEKLTSERSQLAALRVPPSTNQEDWRQKREQLTQESNDVEAALVRKVQTLQAATKLEQITWQDVKKALGAGEAAVEFLRFPYHDGKQWTDKTYYVALVVTPVMSVAPALVFLGEAAQLEGAPLDEYRATLGFASSDAAATRPTFYEAFWKPLEKQLGGAKRIYLSPDGVLNQISLAAVTDPSGRLLIEDYQIRLLLSTKDLLREKRTFSAKTAVLVGDPDFDLTEANQKISLQTIAAEERFPALGPGSEEGLRSGDGQTGLLRPLRGTKGEMGKVQSLLQEKGWDVKTFGEEKALKEVVLRVNSPRVVHLATHGFFEADQDRGNPGLAAAQQKDFEDPMLRSGLYFAGANRLLSGSPPSIGVTDGVLTAFEATGLKLQGTELVVLSACETGLGSNRAGEGVFGLRRALQQAGAESVLMSMWSVPDYETQELMSLFYEKWLSGLDKYQALNDAQIEERARVRKRWQGKDHPELWAAFVVVGQ